ncbi:MAG: M48 family metallopeptidase [Planctomycetota bacterium]
MQLSRRRFAGVAGAFMLGIGCCGCHSAPVTGRRQLMLLPEGHEVQLGASAFQETLAEQRLSSNHALAEVVQRVGERIAAVSGRNDFQWEFKLVESEVQNAFCLPGGKVAVYEGILPVCADEAGVAVVMSHEIAHALARHGGERMSQQLGVNGARMALERIAAAKFPSRSEALLQAYGVATEYGLILPYSRKQESEADHIGLMLMSRAGYDPTSAPDFWVRFGQVKGDAAQAEWHSTHPTDARRSSDLQQLMNEALPIYEAARQQHGRGETLDV